MNEAEFKQDNDEVVAKLLKFKGCNLSELDDNQISFLSHAIDVSRRFDLLISIGDDEVINIKPFINDYRLDDKIYNDMVVQNKLNEFKNRNDRKNGRFSI